jgi:hypothetical protein
MTLEVRVPISPDPHFFRQIAYLSRSFDVRGGMTGRARFRVSVGADCEPYDIAAQHPWSKGRIDWHWVDREEFRRFSYLATANDRLKAPSDADVVLLMDADTLLVRGIDDILESLALQPAIAGLMAHIPPFLGDPGLNWSTVFSKLGRDLPPDRFQHSGWGTMYADPANRFGPAYYNLGVVFIPGSLLPELARAYAEAFLLVFKKPRTIPVAFSAQLAFSVAIYQSNLPRQTLDLRYNFPNDDWAAEKFPADLADVRVIHYLREPILGTRRDTWGSDDRFAAFLERRDLTGANEVLRSAVSELRPNATLTRSNL